MDYHGLPEICTPDFQGILPLPLVPFLDVFFILSMFWYNPKRYDIFVNLHVYLILI